MAYSPVAVLASAGTACTGGAADVHVETATMISGRKMIHTIRLIQINLHEHCGVTGISLENRRTGAVEDHFIQHIIARNL